MASMEIDPPPPQPNPRDRIIHRLVELGVPQKLLNLQQDGLVAFVKNNKHMLPELVSAILPPDEEVAETLRDASNSALKKLLARVTMKVPFRESMLWLKWLMFEGDPSQAMRSLSKMGVGQRGVCGVVWRQNDIVYKCKTCEHDPTCAICVPCFKNGDHEGHDYSIIYTGGGCCDCGDDTAWKRQGFCSKHRGAEQIQPLPEEYAIVVGPVLRCLFDCWKCKLLSSETACWENPRVTDHAAECKKAANELTYFVIEMLLEFCKCSESLLSFVSSMILSSVDFLAILVRAERFLSDAIVRKLHELLLRLMGEPVLKYEFAKVFLNYYATVVSEAIKDPTNHTFKKYPLLPIFSVQILTVPTLTPRLVKEVDLLSILLGCLEDIFNSCAGEDDRLQVNKWSNLFEISVRVIEDFRYVMSHAIVPKYVIHEKQDISRTWMRLSGFIQGMYPLKRETGLHIEEENEYMHLPFVLGHLITKIHSMLVGGAFSAVSDHTEEELFLNTTKQDMDDSDTLRHAKVGRLSQESSACTAVGSSSLMFSEDKSNTLCSVVPSSVTWLTFECLRAIENWLGVDNASGTIFDESSSRTSNYSGINFPAWKRTLFKIRKAKHIFGKISSSSEDHGNRTSPPLHSSSDMSFDIQNDIISGKENRSMAVDETNLANACISPKLGDSAMEIEGPMDTDGLRLMSLSEWPDITYDVSSQDISVHIPLHRLLALLIQRSLRRCYGEEPDSVAASFENQSSTISTDLLGSILGGCHPCGFSAFVMEHPLRIRVFCAQVHAGMWRKNGDAAPYTCEWYRSVRWSEQFVELDLFLLQCCAALAPADLYMERILERFGLSSYLSLKFERSSEYEPVLVKEMLTLIIQIITERRFCGLTKAECVKKDLIHKLSVADATHSQLVKSLPRELTKFPQLNEILDTVAVYSNPSSFNQGTYSLQWTFWKDLDLYYHRWNSRDLQAAEERYLSFRGVSALTSQLPSWTKIYPPFRGLAGIGTCKTVLQIVRAVLFYAVFSDNSADSRAPDEILLTALHLLSLALDVCSEHKGSGDRSCYDGDFIPMIAFACEDISEGLYFEAGQQSLLSLLVILMRMYSKEGLSNSEDGSWSFSSLIGNLLKKFAVIDCGCMTKLQVLAPELVSHVTHPNSDTVISGPASDSERRKAKVKERQAAILEKMRAEQSKFLSSNGPSVDDGSEVENEEGGDVEDNSDDPTEVVCSLCHDPSSKSQISFLVLLQNSRLLSFIDRGPVSWDEPRSADKKHVSKSKGEMTDQSSLSRLLSGSGVVSPSRVRQLSDHVNRKMATGQSGINKLSSGTGVLSPCALRQLVEKAVNEFASHGRTRDVGAFLEVLKDRFHDLRDIQVLCDINDERETTSYTFDTIEEDMYVRIQREVHDKLHSKFIEDKIFTTVEGDQRNTEDTESLLLGYYIASLSRERRENPSSSESSNDQGATGCSRQSVYDGFGPADCDGIYLSSCGHAVHQECLDRYLSSLKERHLRRIVFEGGHIVDPEKGEFLCPVCRGLANSVLPTLPTESQKVSKEPMDTGVSSSHVTSPSCKSAEQINSIQQGLALLQSAANAAGKVATLKDFPSHRCEQKDPNHEPISSLLFKIYFPTELDNISGSDWISYPMLMWDLVKYSLLSMEIASRSGGKYAAPSYSLNALYKELESSSRFILSLLLNHVQNSFKNSLHVLQRFIAIKRFAESTCSGVSINDESMISGQGAMIRFVKNLDNPVAYPDIQFWSRASDPVLARDPFSSLMWVLFCLPNPFLSSQDSLLSLVHVFYVVSVVQGITTYLGKNKSDISGLGVDDCLFTDISKLMREFSSVHHYFTSDYIDSSSNIKNIVRGMSFPYLRRCVLLLKLLNSYTKVPFCERYNVLDRSSFTSNAINTAYVPLVEINDIQEIEAVLKIPSLDVILKDAAVRSLAHKWFCHFGKKYEDKRYPGTLHCNPAVPFQLLRLPRVYHDLLQRYIKQRCSDCNNVLDEPALCLLCGRLCSRSWKPCCRESGCQTHAVACGSGTGVFLLIRRTTILLQRSARQSPWPSPYLDAFGEEDFEMHRGKPLFLNEERYAALNYLVRFSPV